MWKQYQNQKFIHTSVKRKSCFIPKSSIDDFGIIRLNLVTLPVIHRKKDYHSCSELYAKQF